MKIFDDEGLWEPPFASIGPVQPAPRFIVFAKWPLTGRMVEVFLDALGVRYATIRSGQTINETMTGFMVLWRGVSRFP